MEAEGQTGEQSHNGLGTIRILKSGAVVASLLHGRYSIQSRRGALWLATNQAALNFSVALATTYTGLCLTNPLGSGVVASIYAAGLALAAAPAAIASVHIIGAFNATAVVQTTPVTPYSTLLGPGAPRCLAASAATIPTPLYLLPLQGGFTAATLPAPAQALQDLGGIITLQPGSFCCIGAVTAVNGFGTFVWEEFPATNDE